MRNSFLAATCGIALVLGGETSAHEGRETGRIESQFQDLFSGKTGKARIQEGIAQELFHRLEHDRREARDRAPEWFRASEETRTGAVTGLISGARSPVMAGRNGWLGGLGGGWMGRWARGVTGGVASGLGLWWGVAPAGSPPQAVAPPGNAALMSASFGAFKPKVRYYWDAGTFFVESDNMPDGMPDKMVGITAWQQQIPLGWVAVLRGASVEPAEAPGAAVLR